MSIDEHLQHYRPNVGVALFRPDGRVWIGRRVGATLPETGQSMPEWLWQMPQGGIDAGEDLAAAAFRELKEETGVVSARLLTLTPGWLVYDFPNGRNRHHWRGQRQKWAAMLFEGEDSEIALDGDHMQEFDQWRWAELEETARLIVPFKRPIYEDVVRAFAPLRDFLRARK